MTSLFQVRIDPDRIRKRRWQIVGFLSWVPEEWPPRLFYKQRKYRNAREGGQVLEAAAEENERG